MKILENYKMQEINSSNVVCINKKIIPCKKNQLIQMVLDIEKYPEFVPWCLNGKVHSKEREQ